MHTEQPAVVAPVEAPVRPQDTARSLAARLREYTTEDDERYCITHPICDEAADELERAAKSLDEWRDLARFAEQQWQWYGDAYRALVMDLLHDHEHPAGPKRQIDLMSALEKLLGPNAEVTG